MMKNKISLLVLCILCTISSCNRSFLNDVPKGVATEEQLATPENADKMVIAAYAAQGNERYYLHPLSPWPYGDLRGGDAYKGGAGIGDLPEWNTAETFVNMTTDEGGVAGKWEIEYQCISRTNQALAILNKVDYPEKNARIAEMRFLRANNCFWLKVNFRYFPFIDETVPTNEYNKIGNDLTDEQLWGKISDDLQFAAANLPETNTDGAVGRPTKYAAEAYLAKVMLYQAYEQNESNQVVNINTDKLNKVVSLCDDVLQNSGKSLFADFSDNFQCESQNGVESVWAIQFSHNDGTPKGRINGTNEVCYPMVKEYGCCGYHSPSQNLVNAFRTVNGLPDFDHYNSINIGGEASVKSHTIDPRLLHTVAMDSLPYKYKTDFLFDGTTWTRQPESYGRFLSMKETVIYDCACYQPVNPWKSDSKNRDVIRMDDVILWKAEALIQLNRQAEALPLINQIRSRAAQSTARLVDVNGQPTGNFDVRPYIDGVNCIWTKDFAFKALQWERRLELACEGFRAYDLLRWGVMAETMNDYFSVERNRRPHLANATFTKGRDEYLPVPKGQIDLSQNLYKQNYGY
ncbi:MAG: RagB/SusD family nutrient uptake outer membrane protein [Chitinophagaceae bacterium]|nr:RagB/SusD family nutrient uptake outer membrane protein [Chitinophagaceae bacterium]